MEGLRGVMKHRYLGGIAVAAMSVLVEWTGPQGRTQASRASTAGGSPRKERSGYALTSLTHVARRR